MIRASLERTAFPNLCGGLLIPVVLLDTFGHYMPTESRGIADALEAATGSWGGDAYAAPPPEVREESPG